MDIINEVVNVRWDVFINQIECGMVLNFYLGEVVIDGYVFMVIIYVVNGVIIIILLNVNFSKDFFYMFYGFLFIDMFYFYVLYILVLY